MIQTKVSLKPYNTFGVDSLAEKFVKVYNTEQLKMILSKKHPKTLILGGGSNVLFTKENHSGLVICMTNKGINILEETDKNVRVRVSAGEYWNDFVDWAVENNLGGVENLALIPGKVGAAPVQNIGAYGQEIKDTLVSCQTIDRDSLVSLSYSNADCKFGYRDSIFKNNRKDKDVITSVDFILKKPPHLLRLDYGPLNRYFDNNQPPQIKDVANAVIDIRQSKLPDPSKIGNVGSFFKNPVITREHLEELLKKHPQMPFYPQGESHCKVPAGWLIEYSGFKGKEFGNVGVYEKQALILINLGNAKGKEVKRLAKKIENKVYELFQIRIKTEVNYI